jgi:hypothetical protein
LRGIHSVTRVEHIEEERLGDRHDRQPGQFGADDRQRRGVRDVSQTALLEIDLVDPFQIGLLAGVWRRGDFGAIAALEDEKLVVAPASRVS